MLGTHKQKDIKTVYIILYCIHDKYRKLELYKKWTALVQTRAAGIESHPCFMGPLWFSLLILYMTVLNRYVRLKEGKQDTCDWRPVFELKFGPTIAQMIWILSFNSKEVPTEQQTLLTPLTPLTPPPQRSWMNRSSLLKRMSNKILPPPPIFFFIKLHPGLCRF